MVFFELLKRKCCKMKYIQNVFSSFKYFGHNKPIVSVYYPILAYNAIDVKDCLQMLDFIK